MSQERQLSNDSSNDLIQSFYSLNLDQDSDQINLNGLNLNESNSDFNISIENNDSFMIDLSDNDQNVFFPPLFFRINTSTQLNQTYSQDTIEFNNTFDYNDQPNQPIDDQLSVEKIKNPFNKTSFNWDMYNDRNQVLKELRKDKKFVDLQLIAEDGYSEYVHSTIISALGKNLSNFIFSLKNEPNTPCSLITDSGHNFKNHIKKIYLDGISGSVLKVIIDCAYTGYFETDDKHIIWSIINVAERFNMNDILKASCTYLIYQLNVDNCIKLLHLGIKFKHRLRTAAWNFIRLKFDRIVNECPEYVNLTIDELINLLEDDHLNTISGEQIVWEGIRRWILADLINRTKYLNNLLEKLRFGRLQLEYLEEVILKEPLLTEINNGSFNELNLKNEKLNLTKSIASKEIVPFNKNTKKCSNFIGKKLNNSQSSSALNFSDTYKCLDLIKRMICIRKNKQNQYKTDNYNLLIDLNPYFVRPRIPAEVIFVIGGWQDNAITTLIETYDVRTNMWLESFISLEYTRAYHGLEILNGLLYVIGGTNGNKTLSSMHCFNPNNGKWYERANMHERRCYINTTVLNELIYAMGGHNGAQRLNTVEKYDYKTNQWTIISPMNLARSDASAATYDNKIYIAGGLNEQVQNTVEFFNPVDNTWTFLQPMHFQRNSLSLVLFNNCLYALGGTNGTSRLNSVERYDFSLERWELAKPMRCSRSTFKACILEDKLYVVGGHDQNSQIKSVEYYDIQKDEWFEVKSLKRSRSGMAICSYRSFTVSNKYTYNYYAEKQISKAKKKIFKKKEPKAIKNNEQLNDQTSNNHRIKETNLNTTINRFRRRRNQLKLNSTNLVQRSLVTSNRIISNNRNSNENSSRISSESIDLFANTQNEQPSTSRSNNQNQSNNNYNIQKNNSQHRQLIYPSRSRINSIITNNHDSSSSDIQIPSFQIKIRSLENASKVNRIFQTRSLNNDRLIDRENEESNDDWISDQ